MSNVMIEVEVEMQDDNMIRRSHGLICALIYGCSLSTEYISYPRLSNVWIVSITRVTYVKHTKMQWTVVGLSLDCEATNEWSRPFWESIWQRNFQINLIIIVIEVPFAPPVHENFLLKWKKILLSHRFQDTISERKRHGRLHLNPLSPPLFSIFIRVEPYGFYLSSSKRLDTYEPSLFGSPTTQR